MTGLRRRRPVAVAVLVAALTSGTPAGAAPASRCGQADWPRYGRDLRLTFSVPAGCSPITRRTVTTLVPAWFTRARDSVTASPAVVGGTAYVGSWDGRFSALDARTGALRWTFDIRTSAPTAFGRIVSSATVAGFRDRSTGRLRRVVLFGGGSTLWALDAATGAELAAADLDPRTAATKAAERARGEDPEVEVESSPALARVGRDRLVFVGVDVHDTPRVGRTGVVAARLVSRRDGSWSFVPVWKSDAETGQVYRGRAGLTRGSGTGFGCGGVWSSPAVDEGAGVVVYGVANCSRAAQARAAGMNWSEAMVAVDARTGRLRWRFAPAALEPTRAAQLDAADNDDDFGASPNIFRLPSGRLVVGEGQKSARYWVRDLRTGAPVWSTVAGTPGHVGTDYAVGGFIGTPAVQVGADGRARRVVGATAIPVPRSPGDVDGATWLVRALDARTGRLQWVYRLGGPTYAAVSVVGGVVFVPDTVGSDLLALDAETGRLRWAMPVPGPPSSAAVVVGEGVYLGTGTRDTSADLPSVGGPAGRALSGTVGASVLSPASGVTAFRLAVRALG